MTNCKGDPQDYKKRVGSTCPKREFGPRQECQLLTYWRLFNYGIGIHLLQSEDLENMPKKREINPKDNHISFQCESLAAVEKQLKEMGIPYVQSGVEEGGIYVDQLFFHDPDGFMIEICNCDNLPVISLSGEPIMACKRVLQTTTTTWTREVARDLFTKSTTKMRQEKKESNEKGQLVQEEEREEVKIGFWVYW
ncbi:hypothetical protein B296_00006501 [Ensete ventricosum]|uniref:VOC domain-containing protein n=1 Tax=Ensete ventricosum TaxID=4639 RepID=A0A426ZMY7_ENSVE|nr:hypothetical protein B296_00006501 [Ensete ventricosum]